MSLTRISKSLERNIFSFFMVFLSFPFAGATTGGAPTNSIMNMSLVNIAFQRTACSGVVVGPQTVLTARHCKLMGGNPLIVGNFSSDKSSDCDRQKVVDFTTFDPPTNANGFKKPVPDLLLLHLEAPLCNSKPAVMQPQGLSPLDLVFLAGHGVWEHGYGVVTQIEAEVIPFKDIRNNISVPEGMPGEMQKIEKFLSTKALDYIPAIPTTSGQSICPGDSGGPVFVESNGQMLLFGVNGVIIGNDKLGASECGYGYVQFISPIAQYKSWIEETIQNWQQEPPIAAGFK